MIHSITHKLISQLVNLSKCELSICSSINPCSLWNWGANGVQSVWNPFEIMFAICQIFVQFLCISCIIWVHSLCNLCVICVNFICNLCALHVHFVWHLCASLMIFVCIFSWHLCLIRVKSLFIQYSIHVQPSLYIKLESRM